MKPCLCSFNFQKIKAAAVRESLALYHLVSKILKNGQGTGGVLTWCECMHTS